MEMGDMRKEAVFVKQKATEGIKNEQNKNGWDKNPKFLKNDKS